MTTLARLAVLLFFAAQTPPAFQRGDVVHVKGEDKVPSVRIVALPGDRVRVDDSGVYVNGMNVAWISAELLAAIPKPWKPELVEPGQVVVGGTFSSESEGTSTRGNYWAYVGLSDLERVAANENRR